jgi:hypothetical protein
MFLQRLNPWERYAEKFHILDEIYNRYIHPRNYMGSTASFLYWKTWRKKPTKFHVISSSTTLTYLYIEVRNMKFGFYTDIPYKGHSYDPHRSVKHDEFLKTISFAETKCLSNHISAIFALFSSTKENHRSIEFEYMY